jgi:hypothetical protein
MGSFVFPWACSRQDTIMETVGPQNLKPMSDVHCFAASGVGGMGTALGRCGRGGCLKASESAKTRPRACVGAKYLDVPFRNILAILARPFFPSLNFAFFSPFSDDEDPEYLPKF